MTHSLAAILSQLLQCPGAYNKTV